MQPPNVVVLRYCDQHCSSHVHQHGEHLQTAVTAATATRASPPTAFFSSFFLCFLLHLNCAAQAIPPPHFIDCMPLLRQPSIPCVHNTPALQQPRASRSPPMCSQFVDNTSHIVDDLRFMHTHWEIGVHGTDLLMIILQFVDGMFSCH